MIQKHFLIKTPVSLGPVIIEIKKILANTPHKGALLTVYESGYPVHHVKAMVEKIRIIIPELKIAGISLFTIADYPPDGIGIAMNLLVAETSDFEVVSMPCSPGQEDNAIETMRKRLDAHPDAKAVMLFICNLGINATKFMKGITQNREDISVFGTMSSRITPGTLSSHGGEVRGVFKRIEGLIDNNQMIVGDKVYGEGFVGVILYGEDLHIQMEYALGWHPIGKEMPIVKGEKMKLGETTLTEIDGMPAVELYREYLGVRPDEHLIANICEFPLMVKKNDFDICMIPFDYGENGELCFNVTLEGDEKVRFSFATYEEVIRETERAYDAMAEFAPQAAFLVICGNRFNFLREEAAKEWTLFRDIVPNLGLIHGVSELYYINGRGGVLNSAHISVGLREGNAVKKEVISKAHDKAGECRQLSHVIPLAERMSVFMSKMTGQLEGMAHEAEAENIAKSAFLSNMSHEIRTPINAIIGMDEMILRESHESDIIGYADDIRSASNSLLGIVNDVLDFSKIEAGKMDIVKVEYEFASVMNDLYTVIHKRAEDKGLKLMVEVDPTLPAILYGDEIRIKQVMTNIITNAVKYTERGSVTIRVKCIRKNMDSKQKNELCDREAHGTECLLNPVVLKFEVEDTGIGIREEDQKKLFTAFKRFDEEKNRTIEGTGLGLSITRQLLSLMGSELQVESTYGKGSNFSFEIIQGIVRDEPIGAITERLIRNTGTHEKYKEKFTAKTARILVVDDTQMNLEVITNLLKKTLIGIDTAESGQEALDLVKDNVYDLIFLDHRMPNMDGIECFRLMKEMGEDNRSQSAPVISLTANAVSGAREEYLTIGFADYLTKPIDPDKLEEMLLRYLPKDKVKTVVDSKGADSKTKKNLQAFSEKTSIVIIDDDSTIRNIAETILKDSYKVTALASGAEGIKYLKDHRTELILLDVKMPEMDGFDVLREIKKDTVLAEIPVIFLTGDESQESEIRGFQSGAWDFVRKPFVAEVLRQRVKHSVELSRLQKDLAAEVMRQTIKVEKLTAEVMFALSQAVDAKDHYTKGHSERVAAYSVMLAKEMGMSKRQQSQIYAMGLLHDVGKIGVAESIINKPGKLTDEEFDQIKQHTIMGYEILGTITEMPGLATGARWHHEKYNGRGYPDGKSGEDIPLEARIICVADCYDAMTSNRSYSQIREQEKVREEIARCSGSQFDPLIAEHMLKLIDDDREYLMNEHNYRNSDAASYVAELIERDATFGEEHTIYDSTHQDEMYDVETYDEIENDETALPDWLEECQELDVDAGIRNCGSVEGYLSILKGFYETIENKSEEIEGYYDSEDWNNYTIKVHALKSSARIAGADKLSQMAAALESAGDAGDIPTIRRDTKALLDEYRSYQEILKDMAPPDTETLSEAPEQTIKDAYQALSEFSEMMDFGLARMVIDSMKEYRLPKEDQNRFDRIGDYLMKLDWKGVQEEVQEALK